MEGFVARDSRSAPPLHRLTPRPRTRARATPLPPTQRVRTWLRSDLETAEDKAALRSVIDDTAALAELEGLHGHKAAAEARRKLL